jgi:hypothetical protein
VLCLTYLGEFLYDLDGIYLTTSICSWWTVVYYPRSGPLRVAYRDLECIEI